MNVFADGLDTLLANTGRTQAEGVVRKIIQYFGRIVRPCGYDKGGIWMQKDGNGFLVRMDSGDLIFEDINLILANTIKLKA